MWDLLNPYVLVTQEANFEESQLRLWHICLEDKMKTYNKERNESVSPYNRSCLYVIMIPMKKTLIPVRVTNLVPAWFLYRNVIK